MEAEKVQNKPLENKEIHRFIEASRNSSYSTLDSILSKKEKKLFQQRSLLEIAYETEARLKDENLKPDSTIIEETSSTISPEDGLNSTKSSEVENDSSIKVIEEKTRALEQELQVVQKKLAEQEAIIKEEYERGLTDGKKSFEEHSNNKVNSVIDALESAKKSFLNLNATHFIDLREQISKSILNLASDRAGIEINKLPESFMKKIEILIETIDQKTRNPSIYLNPQDLEALQEVIINRLEKTDFVFKSKPGLLHGDMLVDLGSIKANDTTLMRAGFQTEYNKEKVSIENVDSITDIPQELTESKTSEKPITNKSEELNAKIENVDSTKDIPQEPNESKTSEKPITNKIEDNNAKIEKDQEDKE
jgi:flagellar biosynthesis/type III secretory pathway protein FliH